MFKKYKIFTSVIIFLRYDLILFKEENDAVSRDIGKNPNTF